METSSPTSGYELKSELARLCLPASRRDPNLGLAWVNSLCLVFLMIGTIGARRGTLDLRPAPALEEFVPMVAEPVALPAQTDVETSKPAETEQNDPTPVAVVMPHMPNINFSVPTLGSLVVPANLAAAPPLEPLHAKPEVGTLASTGVGGERPAPPYPRLAQQAGEQGTVELLLDGDAAGNVISAEIKTSSGFSMLDRAASDFVKNHWRLPGAGYFQTSITYRLQF